MTTSLTNAYNSLKTCSFCSDVYNVSAKGVTWLSESANKLKVSGGETLSKIASSVASFFSSGAAKIGSFLRSGKDWTVTAFGKCKEAFKALPKEAKIGGAVALAAGVLALLYFRTSEKNVAEIEEDDMFDDAALNVLANNSQAASSAKSAAVENDAAAGADALSLLNNAEAGAGISDEEGDDAVAEDAQAADAVDNVEANVVPNEAEQVAS